ncbi:MAG: B12-binding domain-containing radical SAM protein [Candidatus Brocadiaceae bacterium]|nr:B12-binding domain-containing radical SAM protein [Candidatus Brocadiaceae bacterium]
MKVLLLFPPSWHPSQPYLSIPSLTAFLKRSGIDTVIQRDLNIELLDKLLTKKTCSEFYRRMVDKLKCFDRVGIYSPEYQQKRQALNNAAESLSAIMDKVEFAKNTLRSDGFYEREDYIESVCTINESLRIMSALYYPSSMTALNNDMRYSVYSSRDIFRALDDEEENIFLDLYQSHIISSLLDFLPDVVGISITSTSQIIPGLTLARLVKKHNKGIHITIGGSVFTKLIENIKTVDGLFSIVDSFIVFEGEHALLGLVEQLDGKREFKKVPNLIYRQNGVVRVNEPFYTEDLNLLPTPDFDGFPLSLYLSPAPVIPVQTSRGCYYRKCSFCNLHLDHRNFRLRSTELLLEDIHTLSRKYDAQHFFFTDESVPVNKLREISQGLLKNQWNVKWMGGVRFEKSLTPDMLGQMHESGCQKLVFGLESYNQRVLELMKKGIKVNVVKKILDACLKTGIAFHLYVIVGFPTETEKEAYDTLNFVLKKEYVTSFGYSCLPSLYGMEKDSPMTRHPEEYKLRNVIASKEEDLGLGYVYEVDEGMLPEEAERMYQVFIQRLSEELCPFPYNYSLPDGLLYITHFKQKRGGLPQKNIRTGVDR